MAEGLDDTGFEDCQFLTGSPQRFAVLAQLRERPTLADESVIIEASAIIQRILAGEPSGVGRQAHRSLNSR